MVVVAGVVAVVAKEHLPVIQNDGIWMRVHVVGPDGLVVLLGADVSVLDVALQISCTAGHESGVQVNVVVSVVPMVVAVAPPHRREESFRDGTVGHELLPGPCLVTVSSGVCTTRPRATGFTGRTGVFVATAVRVEVIPRRSVRQRTDTTLGLDRKDNGSRTSLLQPLVVELKLGYRWAGGVKVGGSGARPHGAEVGQNVTAVANHHEAFGVHGL